MKRSRLAIGAALLGSLAIAGCNRSEDYSALSPAEATSRIATHLKDDGKKTNYFAEDTGKRLGTDVELRRSLLNGQYLVVRLVAKFPDNYSREGETNAPGLHISLYESKAVWEQKQSRVSYTRDTDLDGRCESCNTYIDIRKSTFDPQEDYALFLRDVLEGLDAVLASK